MLVPSIFTNNFTDDLFDDMFAAPFNAFSSIGNEFKNNALMNTDVTDYDDRYELSLELPGYSKEDVKASINDGYLTVSAEHSSNSEDKDKEGKVIRKERYTGKCQRNFYVGNEVTNEDIKAAFKDGVLTITVPKKEEAPKVEQNNYIAIEG